MDGKCAWLDYLTLIGHFFHLNRSTQLLSELYMLAFLKKKNIISKPAPPSFSSQYYFTIEISQGLMSSPILPAFTALQARFSQVNSYFTKVAISG